MQTVTLWGVFMSSIENQLFCESSMMVLYDILTNMSTLVKEKKRLFKSDGAADMQPDGRASAACVCRTSGPAGAKEEKSLQWSHGDGKRRGKQSGTDNEKEPEKLHILT